MITTYTPRRCHTGPADWWAATVGWPTDANDRALPPSSDDARNYLLVLGDSLLNSGQVTGLGEALIQLAGKQP